MACLGGRLGFPLPDKMGYRELLVAGVISGIVFVAGEAFTDQFVQGEAKMGAMLSLIAAPVALLVAKAMRIRMI